MNSASLNQTEVQPLVNALFDGHSDVRIAAFGALSRLPLEPAAWVRVESYASWALGSSSSVAEQLAVVEAAPYMPLQSIRDPIAAIAKGGRPEVRSRALDAVSRFPDAPILLAAMRARDSRLDEIAQRLSAVDLSRNLGEIRSMIPAVPRDSDARFWLALGLARYGSDEELKAIFEDLRKGRLTSFAFSYADMLDELLGQNARYGGWYANLRNALVGVTIPAPTLAWLSAIASARETSPATRLAAALLETFDASPLDPPLTRGRSIGFATPTAAARRQANREVPKLYIEASREVIRDDRSAWVWSLAESVMGPALERGVAPALITALFRRAVRKWDILHNAGGL